MRTTPGKLTTAEPPRAAVPADHTRDDGLAAERRDAQEMLLALAQLGRLVSEAMAAHMEPDLAKNVYVLVITSLDTRGPLRPSDIMAMTGMSSGGVTKLLDRLEEDGYVTREYGAIRADRRATRLTLTAEGSRVAQEYANALLSYMDDLRQVIGTLRARVR